jgi:hypothetical protein
LKRNLENRLYGNVECHSLRARTATNKQTHRQS